MASEALFAIIGDLLTVWNVGVRIVAGEAREFVSAGAFTLALPQTLKVTNYFQFSLVRARPNEGNNVLAEKVTRTKGGLGASWLHDSCFAG